MKSTLWKLTALAGVMAAGFLVVYQAQRNLAGKPLEQQTSESGEEFQPLAEDGSSEGGSSDENHDLASTPGAPTEDTPEPTPTPRDEFATGPGAEPTPAWESMAESEPFDPFGGGDDPQPTPADAAEPSEPRPHPLKSRFAELAASFEESPETESAPPQAAPADDASPFAGFGNDFGSAAGASESKQPASSGNPFASGDIPTGSGSPFASDPTPESEPTAASEPTPALAESETTDDSTGDSDASPFARRGSDSTFDDARAASLSLADEDSGGPSLAAPPTNVRQDSEPDDSTQTDEAGGPSLAGASSEAPILPREDDPFGVIPVSNEVVAEDAGDNEPSPFLVLPGDPAPSPVPRSDGIKTAAETASVRESRAEPQTETPLLFPNFPSPPEEAEEEAAPQQPDILPVNGAGDMRVQPGRAARGNPFGDESPAPNAVPAETDADPFGSPPPKIEAPAAESADDDPFGSFPTSSAPPQQDPADTDPFSFGDPPGPAPPEQQPAKRVLPELDLNDSEPVEPSLPVPAPRGLEPSEPPAQEPQSPKPQSLEPQAHEPASPGPVAPTSRPAPDLLLPTEPLPRGVEPAPVDRRVEPPAVEPREQSRPNPLGAQTPPKATHPPVGSEDWEGIGTIQEDSPLGTQQARVIIEKQAPPGAVLGKPLIYSINVQNVGGSVAENVIVKDITPKGSRLVGTSPQAELDEATNMLVWRLGRMTSGETRTIKIKVIPTDPGPIGSVATVSFEAAVAARTVITAPELKLSMQGPDEVGVGEKATYRFTLTNAGTADASGVYIRNIIPEGFEHPRGNDLEYDVGVLRKGQSTTVDLTLMAVSEGDYQNRAVLGAEGSTPVELTEAVSVIASRLVIHREGPANRFVGRAARFTNTITNQSKDVLQDVTVVETIPPGVQLEGASDGGVYDRQRRTVTWHLPSLEPGASRPVQISLIPTQAAEYDSTVKAFSARGASAEVASRLVVAGFSSLKVEVAHDGAPVPIGEDVALRLTIKNRGTAAANQVKTLVEVPPEMRFVNAQGPVRYRLVGDNLIEFEALNRLEIEGEERFDIVLAAAHKGDARVRVELQSAELSRPLNEEELVVIYARQE